MTETHQAAFPVLTGAKEPNLEESAFYLEVERVEQKKCMDKMRRPTAML